MSERKLLPMLPRYEPISMDSTATGYFKECPRKYFYRMVLGRVVPVGEWESVFAWGTSIHKFAELIYTGMPIAEAWLEAEKLFKPPTKPKFMFQDKERWIETIIEFSRFFKNEIASNNIKSLGVEQPFSLSLPDGTQIGGRFDQLIQWNNRTWIRDWKTSSKAENYFAQSLDPNDQAIRYIYAASCLTYGVGDDMMPVKLVDGILFTALFNMKSVGPTIRPIAISRNMSQVKSWVKEQIFLYKYMDICREEDTWPMNEKACTYCEYRVVCTQSSEPAMEQMLKSAFLVSPWKHEEVTQMVEV